MALFGTDPKGPEVGRSGRAQGGGHRWRHAGRESLRLFLLQVMGQPVEVLSEPPQGSVYQHHDAKYCNEVSEAEGTARTFRHIMRRILVVV
jgi:hypothetical protein